MEELSLDNILDVDLADTFGEMTDTTEVESKDTQENNQDITEDNSSDDSFEQNPESVGSEEELEDEDTTPQDNSTSPNFYSSIANALAEEGVFSSLSEEEFSNIQDADDFKSLIEAQIRNQLDEKQKRIDEALNLGVTPSEIQQYEKYIDFLDKVTEDNISDESDQSENLRKNLIYQDYINRGFSNERALKEVEKSFNNGTDIEDAKDALEGNKEYYTKKYNEVLENARKKDKEETAKYAEQARQLEDSILKESKAFGELDVDKTTRQKVYDSIMKPIYTNPDTGEKLTALQKYQSENRTEFLKNVGLMYVMTDGFKNLDGLVKGRVKKEVKKGLRELEHTLNNSSRNSDGSLKFMSGSNDPESKSFTLELDI